VSELSRAGLLERVEDDADRRRTLVRVAPEHAAAIEAFLSRRLEPLRRALQRLSLPERAAFVRGLDVLTEELSLAAATGGVAPGADLRPGAA
jgi:DNA-binding MarR family transcriptional regulator